MKKTYFLTLEIRVEVESQMEIEDVIDEFNSECVYEFPSTENVKVIRTEWVDTN